MSKSNHKEKKELLKRVFPEIFEGDEPNLLLLSSILGVHPLHCAQLDAALEWDEAIDIPSTVHSIIEGDNVSILKGMREWQEKIKVILIDPPYNTGKDFVYQDNWRSEEASDGFVQTHGAWLKMMTLRLRYAHSLLREDGVIFICIDDHEMVQLRMLCDAIFGVRNFVQNFLWLHGKGKKDKHSRTLQQYVVCYAKNKKKLEPWKLRVHKQYEPMNNPDNDERGPWFSGSISFSEGRSNPNHRNYFSITSPSGIVWRRQWLCSKEEMDAFLKREEIYFGPAPAFDRVPRRKMFAFEDDIIPPSVLQDCGTTRSAQVSLNALFGGHAVFDYPKPVPLFRQLIQMASQQGDIVLDFFAGSGTTLQAVLELEREKEERLCICVQRAEKTPTGSVAQRQGFETIFDVLRKRIEIFYERHDGMRSTAIVRKSSSGKGYSSTLMNPKQ